MAAEAHTIAGTRGQAENLWLTVMISDEDRSVPQRRILGALAKVL